MIGPGKPGWRHGPTPAANLFLRLEGSAADAAPVLSGSHIDSQPTGGKFDGSFGVLAALEAVTVMAEHNLRPRRPIEVVAWMNEEGSRFSPGMMGSEAFSGRRPLDQILAVTDADGARTGDALTALLAADPGVPSRPLGFPVHAFIEAHIEQGPILERAGLPIGVVSGMQGSRRFRIKVSGSAAHAGTTPRVERRDAVMAAARMIAALHDLMADPEDVMFTVGMIRVRPNAPVGGAGGSPLFHRPAPSRQRRACKSWRRYRGLLRAARGSLQPGGARNRKHAVT